MSAQQQKIECLTTGYVRETYQLSVPTEIIQIMRLYYDQYYYLSLKDEKLQKFVAAENGERLRFHSFKIKGIEFQFVASPNGSSPHSKGLVVTGIKIRYLPKHIEYFDYYQQLKCETINYCMDRQPNRIDTANQGTAWPLCKLSELKNMERVDFNCLIDIKYIKYKKQYKKKDYIGSINKLHKMSKLKWNIDEEMMAYCKEMQMYQNILSDSFDANNWCLRLCPNAVNPEYEGYTGIFIQFLSTSINTKSFNVRFTILIDGEKFDNSNANIANFEYSQKAKRATGCPKIMKFSEFKKKSSISFEVILEIVTVYDKNDVKVDEKNWDKYDIVE